MTETTEQEIPDYDGGLNQLVADARNRLADHADDETWGIDRAIKAMRNTRAAMCCCIAELNCFQQERAVLYRTLTGILPPPIQLQEREEVGAAIAAPQHRATEDDIARVASDLSYGAMARRLVG